MKIEYRRIYKYELTRSCKELTLCQPTYDTKIGRWITLRRGGMIEIGERYSWDGPSGPARDTKNFMRASLVHDALYQLIQEGKLPRNYRKAADQTLRKLAREDGMSAFRAWYTYRAVRWFGGSHAR